MKTQDWVDDHFVHSVLFGAEDTLKSQWRVLGLSLCSALKDRPILSCHNLGS